MIVDEQLFYGTPKRIFEGHYNTHGWGGDEQDGSSLFSQMLFDHLYYALDHVTIDGSYFEFGVYQGKTTRRIARKIAPKTLYGFDVFTTGLPEAWFCVPKGGFSTDVPVIDEPNIELVVGLYQDTCPVFEHKSPIAFMHVDCDLYSSTKTIFDSFGNYIIPGTVIVFDEYYNYPGFEHHEYKAFKEFLEAKNLAASPIAAIHHEGASPASFIVQEKDKA
jgi:predicted O-methyltransferase YrrM